MTNQRHSLRAEDAIMTTSPVDTGGKIHTMPIVKPSDSVVYHQGDAAAAVFRVRSGIVMAYRIHCDGTRQITGFFQRGEMIGLDGDGVYIDTAVMVSDGRLETIPTSSFLSEPAIQHEVYTSACHQLHDAQELIMSLTRKSSDAKVAEFLLHLARPRRDGETGLNVTLPGRRQDIADYLGVSAETVSRRLAAFRREGLVELPDRRSARILDIDALVARALASRGNHGLDP